MTLIATGTQMGGCGGGGNNQNQFSSIFEQQAYIKVANPDMWDLFGSAVASSGSRVAVANGGTGEPEIHIYKQTGKTWTLEDLINHSTSFGDQFGISMAMSGDTLVVGACLEDSTSTGTHGPSEWGAQYNDLGDDIGAVYVFTRSGTSWTQEAYIKASYVVNDQRFGTSVALDGDTLAASTRDDEVFVFTRTDTTWTQQDIITGSNTVSGDDFGRGERGRGISLSGDTLAVGAIDEDSESEGTFNGSTSWATAHAVSDPNPAYRSGAVYIFKRTGTSWSQESYIKASNTGEDDQFGGCVALYDDTLVVGSRWEDSDSKGPYNGSAEWTPAHAISDPVGYDSGAVYIFSRVESNWTQEAYIKASNCGPDTFGSSIALSGDFLAVGAWQESSGSEGPFNGSSEWAVAHAIPDAMGNSGAVYLFKRNGETWTQESYIKASNPGTNDYFGISISLSGNTLAVGSPNEDSENPEIYNGSTAWAAAHAVPDTNTTNDFGAVYVYDD